MLMLNTFLDKNICFTLCSYVYCLPYHTLNNYFYFLQILGKMEYKFTRFSHSFWMLYVKEMYQCPFPLPPEKIGFT